MRYHLLYADESGQSRWKDVDVALEERSFAPPAKGIQISHAEPSTGMIFLKLHAGWSEPVHPTPTSQTLICLTGAVRVTPSDGETRDIGPGDVWRMEDLTGEGHHTRVTSDDDFHALIVQHA